MELKKLEQYTENEFINLISKIISKSRFDS
ncbi:bacteriocin immunity protein [Photorhabdus caribbeanensis]|nr:hypothetical protein [Photorhabdus caribbeanensis]